MGLESTTTWWAIGDIHGKAQLLREMLEALPENGLSSDDVLVFLGDYIDRGEDSKGVIDLLLELQAERPNTIFLRGNHEQMLLNARTETPRALPLFGTLPQGEATSLWLENGGAEALESYAVSDYTNWQASIPAEHWAFFDATRLEFVTEPYHFVHAGLLPEGRSWEGAAYRLEPRLWIREPFLSSEDDFGGRWVIFGHTPQNTGRPLVRFNKLGIDTGAAFGGPLTTVELPTARPPDPTRLRFLQIMP